MQRRRINALVVLLILAFGCIGWRLFHLQVRESRAYQVQAETTRRSIRYVPPARGNIYDRSGQPLAVDVPSQDLVFTLEHLERARAISRSVSRALRATEGGASYTEDYLFFLLQGIRQEVRAELEQDQVAPRNWLLGVPLASADSLERRLRRYPDRLAGVHVMRGTKEAQVVIEPRKVFAGETAVLRVARRLGEEDPHAFFARNVWVTYRKARRLRNRTARQWAFEEERVLFRTIPFDLVIDVTHNPDLFPGLTVRDGTRRSYPAGTTLAQLVGYLGAPTRQESNWRAEQRLLHPHMGLNDIRAFLALRTVSYLGKTQVGVAGLENYFEEELRGRPGARIFEVDRFGQAGNEPLQEAPMTPGRDVVLTLDVELCAALEDIAAEHGIVKGSILVGDPRSGDLLGWASIPAFDADDRSSWDFSHPGKPFLNRPLRRFSPGSTFKPVLATGALQEQLITPHEIVTCTGYFDPHHRGHLRCPNHGFAIVDIDLRQSVARSCNYYYYELGRNRLNKDGIRRWAHLFGFGNNPTGIPFRPTEATIQVRHAESSSIGKGGILCTPLQLLRYTMGLASRGSLPDLRILNEQPTRSTPIPVDPWVWDSVLGGMLDAVHRHYGTANDREIGLRQFDCAVKTGTAGLPGSKRNIAWVIGFAPYDSPKLAFVVQNEDTELHGGDGAGPAAAAVLQWLSDHRDYALRQDDSR